MNDQRMYVEVHPAERAGHVKIIVWLDDAPLFMDTLNIASSRARDGFLAKVCERFPGLADNRDAIERTLLQWATGCGKGSDAGDLSEQDADPQELLRRMPESAREQARTMLESPDLMTHVVADIGTVGVAGEKELAAAVYLIGVSRLLRKPLAAIVQGPSSSGKSFVVESVGRLFPPESVTTATQMTPQALYHLKPGRLKHRFVVAGERRRAEGDETAEATRALREMLSSGRLVKLIPVKAASGAIETLEIVQQGPIAYIETTSLAKVFDEDANRCQLLNTDERPEQTKRILAALSRAAANGRSGSVEEGIILKHHALQRMLEQLPVVVPYAEKLAEMVPVDQVEVRRAFPQLLSMIQASALLHQRQRRQDPDGRLIADEDDYRLARRLMTKPLGKAIGRRVSDPARRFLDRLRQWFAAGEAFTTRDAVKRESCSRSAVYGWLSELADAGLVARAQEPYGRTPGKWELTDTVDEPADCVLPAIEKVFP